MEDGQTAERIFHLMGINYLLLNPILREKKRAVMDLLWSLQDDKHNFKVVGESYRGKVSNSL
jgi:hypothetical protein